MFLHILYWALFIVLILGALYLCYKIARADLGRRIIPDAYLFPLMLIGLVIVTFFPWVCSIETAVIGMVFGYIMAAIVGLIFDKILLHNNPGADAPIGMGDIKLISVGGLWLGTVGLSIALVLACIFGATWAYRKKQKFIPFAPFFIIGGILSWLANMFLL